MRFLSPEYLPVEYFHGTEIVHCCNCGEQWEDGDPVEHRAGCECAEASMADKCYGCQQIDCGCMPF